jgi:hypothetical protein
MALFQALDILSGKVKMPERNFSCHKCGIAIRESETGCRKLGDGKFACSGCYFEDFGDAIEAYPILPPRARWA